MRGTFGYANDHALEVALALARHQLGDQRGADADLWLRGFERLGATLRVDVALPAAVDPEVAIGVLETLADAATFGVVQMHEGDRELDWFSANCND